MKPFETAWLFLKMGERQGMPVRWGNKQNIESQKQKKTIPRDNTMSPWAKDRMENAPSEDELWNNKIQTAMNQFLALNEKKAEQGEAPIPSFADHLINIGLWDEHLARTTDSGEDMSNNPVTEG
jgi:hypothetical protein